ncbi:phage antirepressor N-terminal domain-containing protein [Roseivirga seohaensis]|uniref:phage antirepressor N-terminal domain-containing protein n=1 Tax=Roseivirga seohaensis TaxID=1914963 RepID=UPI003BAC75AE
MKEQDKEDEYTQLGVLQEFQIMGTAVLAGIVHSHETIALKRVCENLGLDWHGQRQRLQRNEELSQLSVQAKQVAPDGKKYDMLCLPPMAFQEWLYSLNDAQSENLNKELLLTYQKGLVIQLMMMLKMSMDEIERLRIFESKFISLSNHITKYMDEIEKGADLRKKSTEHFKNGKDLKEDIIGLLSSGMNQIDIGFTS